MPPVPRPETTVAIGIDDFAFRRGTTYGTIIVDHITGRPIDLLNQREAAGIGQWLSALPPAQFLPRKACSFCQTIMGHACTWEQKCGHRCIYPTRKVPGV